MLAIYFTVLICFSSSLFVYSFEDSENVIASLYKTRINRVDKNVKRPVRFCQGFEDPTEIDCYMRSDIKPYVCTEPVSFNPCESLQRVETFHYDHIIHKCVKVNVPACEGQIIRVLTLLQCLIYCHNKDPFALGKSRSMVFKLNQAKPYVPHEPLENEREKILKKGDSKISISKSNTKDLEIKIPLNKLETSTTKAIESIVMHSIKNPAPETLAVAEQSNLIVKPETENSDEDLFANTLNGDAELAEYIINGAPDLLKKEPELNHLSIESKSSPSSPTTQPIITLNNNEKSIEQNQENDKKKSIIEDNNEIKETDNTEKKAEEGKVENIKIEILNETLKVESKEPINGNENKDEKPKSSEIPILSTASNTNSDEKQEMLLIDLTKKSDSTDQSKDDGFYLWDE